MPAKAFQLEAQPSKATSVMVQLAASDSAPSSEVEGESVPSVARSGQPKDRGPLGALHYFWRVALAANDRIAVVYFAILLLLVALADSSPERTATLVRGVICLVVVVGGALMHRHFLRLPHALRHHAYRAAKVGMVTLSYLMLRDALPVIRHDHLDAELLAVDYWLFGFEPSLWLQRYNELAIIEWFSFFYFSYFWICAGYLLSVMWLVPSGRTTHVFAVGSLLVLFCGQLGYMLVPGFGPLRHLASSFDGPIQGGFFWNAVQSTVNAGSAFKDIFPSLHTAMPAWFAMFAALEARRDRRFWIPALITGFFSLNIIVSTMLLRWHYAIDVIAGLALAIGSAYLSQVIVDKEALWRSQNSWTEAWPKGPLELRQTAAKFDSSAS